MRTESEILALLDQLDSVIADEMEGQSGSHDQTGLRDSGAHAQPSQGTRSIFRHLNTQ